MPTRTLTAPGPDEPGDLTITCDDDHEVRMTQGGGSDINVTVMCPSAQVFGLAVLEVPDSRALILEALRQLPYIQREETINEARRELAEMTGERTISGLTRSNVPASG